MTKEEINEMRAILSRKIGLKNIRKMYSIDIDKIYDAMDTYAKRYSWRERIEGQSRNANMKTNVNGAVLKKALKDYVNMDSWKISSIQYVYPDVVEVVMNNVSDISNPKKTYKQNVSVSYVTQICRELFGHGRFEQLPEFIEESLIKKSKVIK